MLRFGVAQPALRDPHQALSGHEAIPASHIQRHNTSAPCACSGQVFEVKNMHFASNLRDKLDSYGQYHAGFRITSSLGHLALSTLTVILYDIQHTKAANMQHSSLPGAKPLVHTASQSKIYPIVPWYDDPRSTAPSSRDRALAWLCIDLFRFALLNIGSG